MFTLGIDIGTYASKGVIADHAGNIFAQAETPHKMIVPQPGWAEHRPDQDWWGDFALLSRRLLADSGIDPGLIKCVATSAIGPCMLPVDEVGRPLMNGVLYGVDTRAQAEIEFLTQQIGAEKILKHCGNTLTSQSVGPKILWLKNQRPDLYASTACILTSTSYLVWKLTGKYVIDHYTAANFSPLYDVDRLDWTDALAPDILPLEKLPNLLWSTEIAGHITAQAASETGLATGTPVTTGTIDAAAEAVSVGVRDVGDMMLMYGSTIFIITLTDQRVRDPALWYAPWQTKGTHASMAGLATSGTLTHWFRDQFAQDLPRDTAFQTLAEQADKSPPGANGLIMLPYFSGERTPIHDVHAKGAIFGLNLTHTKDDIYRALIEGIGYGTKHVLETFEAVGQRPGRLLAVGGGTENRLWLQATSDISGLDQTLCEKTLGASFGNAYLAALAIGVANPGDITDWNPAAHSITAAPNPVYARNYRLFRRFYEQTKDIATALDDPIPPV